MKYVVRKTIQGPLDSIQSRTKAEGDKFAAAFGCDGYSVNYGEFVHIKDSLYRKTSDARPVSRPEFKVIVRFTLTTAE